MKGKAKDKIRLVGGAGENEGWLQLKLPTGEWSAICAEGFRETDAMLACDELCVGAQTVQVLPARKNFGDIAPSLRFSTIVCEGTEGILKGDHVLSF